jgi:hypothetical protein
VSSCPTNPFSLLPKVILTAPHLSFQQRFFSPGWVFAFPHFSGANAKPTFPQLNLHNTRVRRNSERLPSSRCIESAQHRARARISASSRFRYISNEAGRVKSFFAPDLSSLTHTTTLVSADDSPRSPIFHSCPTYFARARVYFIDSVLPTKHLSGHSRPRWFIRTPCLSGRRVAHSALRSLQGRTIYRPGIPARASPLFCRCTPRRQNSL